MKHDIRKIAARQCAQAITVGILMDQVRLMREAGAFLGRAETQALKVERRCQNVMPLEEYGTAASNGRRR